MVASYRLLPDHYPAQAHDTEAVVAWVHANIRRFGGAPGRIYIGGHSAGAIMSTLAALKRDWAAPRRLPADVIKGVVAVSGPYDLRQATGFVADYLPDPATRAGASPLLHVAAGAPPMIVAFGTLESPYVKSSPEFVDALVRVGSRRASDSAPRHAARRDRALARPGRRRRRSCDACDDALNTGGFKTCRAGVTT